MTTEKRRKRKSPTTTAPPGNRNAPAALPDSMPPGLEKLQHIGMGLWSAAITITPDLAREWLENWNYGDNRNISKNRVAYYGRRVTRGGWVLNAEAIIFDRHGGLLNGQHRLKTVVETGTAIESVVTFGVETEAFTTMDQAYTRNGAQILSMKGYANSTVRSAVCRAIFVWETSGGSMSTWSNKVAPDELLLVQETYAERVDAAVEWANNARKDVPISSGLLGLAHFLLTTARPRKATEFLTILSDGVTAERGHPALVLRNKMIRDKLRDRQLPAEAQWWCLVRAWNAYDKGQTIRALLVKRSPDGHWVQHSIRGLKAPSRSSGNGAS